jgi:hypothetical protein
MMFSRPDPAAVPLQVLALGLDGTAKLDVLAGTVRVYQVTGAGEVDVLAGTPLVRVGTTSTWRYYWEPVALPAGQYVAEYHLVDAQVQECVVTEDLSVHDIALQGDLALVRQMQTGRWHIVGDQMIFYGDDGTTPILTCDLRDQAGLPSMESVFERVPV